MGSSGVLRKDPARIGLQVWWCRKSPFSPGGCRLTLALTDRHWSTREPAMGWKFGTTRVRGAELMKLGSDVKRILRTA